MANRFVLNETSYHGAGAIANIAVEAKNRAFRKAFVCSDLDKDTKDRLAKGERIVEVLKQDQNSPLEVEEQVVIIYAVVHNFLKDIPVEKIKQYQADLLDHIKSTDPEILTSIKTEKVITPDNEEKLKSVLTDFAKGYTA